MTPLDKFTVNRPAPARAWPIPRALYKNDAANKSVSRTRKEKCQTTPPACGPHLPWYAFKAVLLAIRPHFAMFWSVKPQLQPVLCMTNLTGYCLICQTIKATDAKSCRVTDLSPAASQDPAEARLCNIETFHHSNGTEFPMTTEQSTPPRRSFLETLQHDIIAARASANEDPWEQKLRKLKGKIGHDGIERISTYDVFDVLEVPMRRRPSETVRLSRLMHRLGWTNIRARGLNPGSYRDRVRGYAREVQNHPVTVRLPNAF